MQILDTRAHTWQQYYELNVSQKQKPNSHLHTRIPMKTTSHREMFDSHVTFAYFLFACVLDSVRLIRTAVAITKNGTRASTQFCQHH